MNTMWDVQQLLKRFGIFVYVGNRLADLELMEREIRDLYELQLIDVKDFQLAILVLRREQQLEREKNTSSQ
ncbi:YqgQ family protein [Bacillus thermotolerans]|nr:YqgQ family protein [Bacillus thermotolerans]